MSEFDDIYNEINKTPPKKQKYETVRKKKDDEEEFNSIFEEINGRTRPPRNTEFDGQRAQIVDMTGEGMTAPVEQLPPEPKRPVDPMAIQMDQNVMGSGATMTQQLDAQGNLVAPAIPQPQGPQTYQPEDVRNVFRGGMNIPTQGNYFMNFLKDIAVNNPQAREENLKEMFGKNYKETVNTKDGKMMIVEDDKGNTRQLLLDAPNIGNETIMENINNMASDMPDFTFEFLKYRLGMKALGSIPVVGGLFNVTDKTGKLAMASKNALGGGVIEGTTTALTTRDANASVRDAGTEGLTSFAFDSALNTLGAAGRLAAKIPYAGTVVSNTASTIDKWIIGGFAKLNGGTADPKMAEALGGFRDREVMTRIGADGKPIEFTVRSEVADALKPVTDADGIPIQNITPFSERIIRESSDIPANVKENLLRNIAGKNAEYVIGSKMLSQATETIDGLKTKMINELTASGSPQSAIDNIRAMPYDQFINSYIKKTRAIAGQKKLADDINQLQIWMDNPNTKIKPSDILTGQWVKNNKWMNDNISSNVDDMDIYIRNELQKRNPKTVKEYFEENNKIAQEMRIRTLNSSSKEKDLIYQNIDKLEIDLNRVLPKDRTVSQEIKEIIGNNPLSTGIAAGFAMDSVATGGVATGVSLLIKNMARENPKVLVEKLSYLSQLGKAKTMQKYDSAGNYGIGIEGGMSPEMIMAGKAYLQSREASDLLRYLSQNVRRQTMEPDFKERTDRYVGKQIEKVKNKMKPNDAPLDEKLPQSGSAEEIMRRKAMLLKK